MRPLTDEERTYVQENLGLAYSIAKQAFDRDWGLFIGTLDDIANEACLGLMNGVTLLKSEMNPKQKSVFLFRAIRNHLYNRAQCCRGIVRVPHATAMKLKGGLINGVKADRIRAAIDRARAPQASIDELRTCLGFEPQETPAEHDETSRVIHDAISHLSEREATVIRRRFGLGCEPETLEDVGRTLGLTRERVRQLQNEALEQLRSLTKGTV
jgi:RNA polymerase sigma factor (sigma-70 family)